MNKVESRRPLAPPAPPRLLARARDNAGHTPARTQPNCGSSVKSVPHCPLAREAEITISPLSLFFLHIRLAHVKGLCGHYWCPTQRAAPAWRWARRCGGIQQRQDQGGPNMALIAEAAVSAIKRKNKP
jgi:hypothetical protein